MDGKFQKDYTGLAENGAGWWRIVDGKVDFSCNGLVDSEYVGGICAADGLISSTPASQKTSTDGGISKTAVCISMLPVLLKMNMDGGTSATVK